MEGTDKEGPKRRPDTHSTVNTPSSVQELTELLATSDAIDVTSIGLDHLGQADVNFLTNQTERTLNRHVEVQQNQRQQAVQILKATVAFIGALITAAPLVNIFLKSVTFPENVPAWRSVSGFLLIITVGGLGQEIVADIYNILETTFDILTPETTQRGAVGTVLTILNVTRAEVDDKEAGGGVRSVSILDELAPVVDNASEDLKEGVIRNRLNRIRRNEKAINQNIRHLHDIYQRAKLALERSVAIFFLVVATLALLGGRVG